MRRQQSTHEWSLRIASGHRTRGRRENEVKGHARNINTKGWGTHPCPEGSPWWSQCELVTPLAGRPSAAKLTRLSSRFSSRNTNDSLWSFQGLHSSNTKNAKQDRYVFTFFPWRFLFQAGRATLNVGNNILFKGERRKGGSQIRTSICLFLILDLHRC